MLHVFPFLRVRFAPTYSPLAKQGIKYATNFLRMALFGYLDIRCSTERSDVISKIQKKALILPPGLKNLSLLLTRSGFFALFERKNDEGEVRV